MTFILLVLQLINIMRIVKFYLLLISIMILTISTSNSGKIKSKIIDKQSFKVHDSILGVNQFKIVYYIYYSDYSYISVSKEYFESVDIGEEIK